MYQLTHRQADILSNYGHECAHGDLFDGDDNDVACAISTIARRVLTETGDLRAAFNIETAAPEGFFNATWEQYRDAYVPPRVADLAQCAGLLPASVTGARLVRACMGRDDAFWGILPDQGNGATFERSGYSAVQCTGFAVAIRDGFGSSRVQVRGFDSAKNPNALLSKGSDGHDFAVLDGRFIIDPWVCEVENVTNRGVFDLTDHRDAGEIARIYGDGKTWATAPALNPTIAVAAARQAGKSGYRRDGKWLITVGHHNADWPVAFFVPKLNGEWTDAKAMLFKHGDRYAGRLTHSISPMAGVSAGDFILNPDGPSEVPGYFPDLASAQRATEDVVERGVRTEFKGPIGVYFGEVIHLKTWVNFDGRVRPASEHGGITIGIQGGHRSLGLDIDNETRYVGDAPDGRMVWKDDGEMYWVYDPHKGTLTEALEPPAGLIDREGVTVSEAQLPMPPLPKPRTAAGRAHSSSRR